MSGRFPITERKAENITATKLVISLPKVMHSFTFYLKSHFIALNMGPFLRLVASQVYMGPKMMHLPLGRSELEI